MNEDTKSLLAKLFEARVKEEKQKIDQFVDEAVENISFEMGFYNEKYYKNGFSDAIKLISECLSK